MKQLFLLLTLIAISLPASAQLVDIKDSWKQENGGPYVEAPPNCGGGWYYVNPFNQTPWQAKCSDFKEPTKDIPEDFKMAYGEYPNPTDYRPNIRNWQAAKDRYEQDLKYFVRIVPSTEITDEATMRNVETLTSTWGLGIPIFVEGRYGIIAKFPFAQNSVRFESTPGLLVEATHIVIAMYQVKVAKETGVVPTPRHPFLDSIDLLN